MITQRALLKETVKRLKDNGVDMPVLDARLLLQYALGIDWAALFTGPDRELSAEETRAIEALIGRRLAREPISRIVGRRGFWKFDLAVSPATLDPRPDTETLIVAVLKLLPDMAAPMTVLDLGTGSGAILLALLGELPGATGTGVDLSDEAVGTAYANALELGMQDRVEFIARDWNEVPLGRHDIVVSNPPYVRSGDIPHLAPEVKDFDPIAALDGGPDGLDAYRSLAALVPAVIAPGGLLALEIGAGQAEEVEAIFAAAGFGLFGRWKDLGGIERVVTARFRT